MANEHRARNRFIAQLAMAAVMLTTPASVLSPIIKYYMAVGTSIFTSLLWGPKPDKPRMNEGVYAWNYRTNDTANADTAMPVVYGTTRVKPVLKNRYIKHEGKKQYLYALYGLTGHKVDERTLERWNPDTVTYTRGTEVKPPAYLGTDGNYYNSVASIPPGVEYENVDEPGKTYKCIITHRVNPLFSGHTIRYNNEAYWRTGTGTADMSSDNIYINDNPLSSYYTGDYDDFSWETRPGLAQQSVIEDFDVTYNNTADDQVLYPDYPTFSSTAANFQYITAGFTGVSWNTFRVWFQGTPHTVDGDVVSSVPADTYYMIWDSTNPTTLSVYTEWFGGSDTQYSLGSVSVGEQNMRNVLMPSTNSWYTPSTWFQNAHNVEVTLRFPGGLYTLATTAEAGQQTRESYANVFAQYREVGTSTWVDFEFESDHTFEFARDIENTRVGVIRANETQTFEVAFKARKSGRLDPTRSYEIRLCVATASEVRVVNMAGVTQAQTNADGTVPGYSYPGEALLAIRALATGKLSGTLDTTAVVTRSTVDAYNNSIGTWVSVPADSHAWAAYDILANGNTDHPAYPSATSTSIMPVYGCGIDGERLDYASFYAWHSYTYNTLGYRLNITFDSFTSAWDAVMSVCREGRGVVHPVGSDFFATVDKPEPTNTQDFTKDDVVSGSLTTSFMDETQKANAIEVSYYDADRKYEEQRFIIRSSDWDTSDLVNPVQLKLYGTTGYAQAFALARYNLNSNLLNSLVVQFDTELRSLACMPGDVVGVTHAEFLGGTRRFRVIEIQRNEGYNATITAVEYHEAIYQTDPGYSGGSTGGDYEPGGDLSVGNVGKIVPELGLSTAGFNTASNIQLREVITYNRSTGEYESYIGASWMADSDNNWGQWDVSWRDVDASDTGWENEWAAATAYDEYDKVYHDGAAYVSLTDNNTDEPFER